MPINLREDVAYILLKKIAAGDKTADGKHKVELSETDFTGRSMTKSDLLGHLDYMNQKGYIDAQFSGNAYATQEDVPDLVDSDQVEARVANTYGAPDGPLPHLIEFEKAELTDRGRRLLEKMNANPPEALGEGPTTPIATKNMPFLEKIMLKGELEDIFDARDITEVVYRVMRDMMTTEASDRVAAELKGKPADEATDDKALKNEISELWKDTNPIVGFLSRIRPPFKQGEGILAVDDSDFIFRVANESSMQRNADPERVIKAVFSATKEEISQDRIQEISGCLPGKVREIWETA
ncbi:MAG: DUF2267 domain-containing protein [Elainellaceae cyanobacterium]